MKRDQNQVPSKKLSLNKQTIRELRLADDKLQVAGASDADCAPQVRDISNGIPGCC